MTLCSKATEYAKVDVKTPSKRNALLSWRTKTGSCNETAVVVGWGESSTPNNFYHSIDFWQTNTTETSGCSALTDGPEEKGQLGVEFYITDAWLDGGHFKPGGTTWKAAVDGNGGKYDIYVGGSLSRDQRCTDGRNFQQVWAVCQGPRSVGKVAFPCGIAVAVMIPAIQLSAWPGL